jgi:hypothetical protein
MDHAELLLTLTRAEAFAYLYTATSLLVYRFVRLSKSMSPDIS